MKKWQKITLIGCGTCLVLACLAGIAGVIVAYRVGKAIVARVGDFDDSPQAWEECSIPDPSNAATITFMQKGLHPFLAEYEYKVRFGQGAGAVERWLPLNCGGRTLMNAYWYPSDGNGQPCIRLHDHWGEYLLKLGEQKTYLVIRHKGRVYAGEISESAPGSSISEVGWDDDAEVSVSVGSRDAIDITESPMGQSPGRYFGRIDGQQYPLRFVPASQSPERQIQTVP